MTTIMVAHCNSTHFMHDKGCPPPSPHSMNVVPKLVFNLFSLSLEAKKTNYCS